MTTNQRKRNVLYVSMFLSSISFFSFFPYLSMLLRNAYALSYWQIGALVGSIALIASCGSWWGGWLADRWQSTSQIQWANLLYSLALLSIFYFENIAVVVAAILIIGFARLLLEPAIKKELLGVDDGTGKVFRIRYLSLIYGAILGPVLSGLLLLWSEKAGFLLAAALHFGCLLLFSFGIPAAPARASLPVRRESTLNVPPILILILIGLLFFLGVSQLTTTIPLYLHGLYGAQSEYVYRSLLLANAALAAFLTFNIGWVTRLLSPAGQVISASAALSLAFITLIFAESSLWVLGATVILYTYAEVLLFPLPDTLVTRYAGAADHGLVLGLLDLRYIAFFLGPVTGGYLLGESAPVLFVSLALAMMLIYPMYRLLDKKPLHEVSAVSG